METGPVPYGRRLAPNVVDNKARRTPDLTYAEYPDDNWETNGYRKITWKQVADAANAVSFWLDETLGKAKNFETLAYLGANDLRYVFLLLAAVKTGRKILIPDGRVTGTGLLELLQSTQCTTWLGSQDRLGAVDGLQAAKPDLRIFTMPSLAHWLGTPPGRSYVYTKTWEEAKDDPIFIVHTSGTTGKPKPIVHTTSMVTEPDFWRGVAQNAGPDQPKMQFEVLIGQRHLSPLPPQWLAGIGFMSISPVYWDTVPILLPADTPFPANADIVQRVHRVVGPFDGGFYTPGLLKELCQNPETLSMLRSHRWVMYGGAALDEQVGDQLCKYTEVTKMLATTEGGIVQLFRPQRPDLWKYYHFHPLMNFRMVPLADGTGEEEDGLYELTIEKDPTGKVPQSLFVGFPDLDVYHTQDLYSKHPTIPDIWDHRGRTGDLMKLAGLAKFHARDVEAAVEKCPDVRMAMLGGEGRPVPFLLVEIKQNGEGLAPDVIIDRVWEIVDSVNKDVTEEGRISREMILLADPDRPFRLNLKSSLDRRRTLELYAHDVEMLYQKHTSTSNGLTDQQTHGGAKP